MYFEVYPTFLSRTMKKIYSKLPKRLLKDNLGIIVLFHEEDIDLRHIFREYVLLDMTYEEFKVL